AELATAQFELGLLRVVQPVGIAPVAAAVDQATAQHGRVQVVAQVVVALAHFIAAASALQVEQARKHRQAQVGKAAYAPVDARGQQPVQETVQRRCLPGGIHVRLAQCQRAACQQARRQLGVVDPQVPGARPVDADVRIGEQVLQTGPETRVDHAPAPCGDAAAVICGPVYCAATDLENSGRYAVATCGNSTAVGTSTVCTPSE